MAGLRGKGSRGALPGAVASLASLALLGACGADDDRRGGDDYAADYARAACANLGPCCAANGLSFDRDACVLGAAGFVQSGIDRAKAAGATFDAEAAAKCVTRVRELSAACLAPGEDASAADACARVWNGPKAPGAACESDLECRSDPRGRGRCVALAGGGDRRCVVAVPATTAGDACAPDATASSGTVADCSALGLQCSLGGTCMPLAGIGDGCPGFVQCEDGAYCAPSSRVCTAQAGPGAACTANQECASDACVRGACGENAVGTVAPCTGEPE